MQSPKEKLKEWTKWIAAHLAKTILSLTLGAVVLCLGGIFHVYGTIWIYVKRIAPQPTPIWATASLVLVVLAYIYLKNRKNPSISPKKPPFFVETGKYKWRASHLSGSSYLIEKTPFCIKHDYQLIPFKNSLICPHAKGEDICDVMTNAESLKPFYETAKSFADKEIRIKKL